MTSTTQRVHDLYWNRNFNCARTMLACLGERFDIFIEPQTLQAATGMLIGIAAAAAGKSDKDIEKLCFRFAEAFTTRFGSLLCRDLRPGGFRPSDPPHACESLTVDAVDFAEGFLQNALFSSAAN